jgi:excisionase family DNA binding protein
MSGTALEPASQEPRAAGTYTIKHIAALLNISTRTAWRLADEGIIPGRLKGVGMRCVRWNRRVVDEWLESRSEAGE